MSPKKKNKEEDIENEKNAEDTQQHLELVKDILENTQASIKKALNLLKEKDIDSAALLGSLEEAKEASAGFVASDTGNERIIEGVFNGEQMVSGDGVEYNVPSNYASKSKLVEGDILKLTITRDGSFLYKQIGPVERKQLVADLAQAETGEWYAMLNKDRWKLLTASVTYFQGQAGDEVVVLIPKEGKSQWAAVENIIKGKK